MTLPQLLASYAEACLDSVASLLSAIEATLAADAPLSDEQIEGMKWAADKSEFDQSWSITRNGKMVASAAGAYHAKAIISAQHEIVDELAREIRRLRAEVGRKESPDAR